MKFGGIYLDRDVYVVQSLDVFRKYEMSLNWEEDWNMSIGTLIAHKNARFLKLWLETYHDYHPDEWFYNGGVLPTEEVLVKRPELVHRVKWMFGAEAPDVCPLLYAKYHKSWSEEFYTIHLSIQGNKLNRWCKGLTYEADNASITEFDEKVIVDLNTTFGEMTRILFDFEKNSIS